MKIGEKLPFWRSTTTTSQTTETRWKRNVGAVVTGNRAFGGHRHRHRRWLVWWRGAARSIFAIRTIRDLGFVTFVGLLPFRFSTFLFVRKRNVKCVGVALGCKEIKKGSGFA